MKLATELRDVTTSGVMEVARATIKATPKIFNFFADQTYANKKLAIVRELSANAVDSHVMAGIGDRPIEIWLPTNLDPTFRVRDHGLGMSHEFMMTRFMAYTDGSTKDDDNLAIGGFGIGSKSPFAYTDNFNIRSVFDGVVSVYSMFKDEDGIPAIALLAQKTTDERNGVEVSLAVQTGDAAEFEDAAFKALTYFEPLPIVHNATKGAFQPPQYASHGKGWGMRAKPGELNVIMGGIPYPCVTSSLDYEIRYDERLATLLGYGLDLRLPIGSCDIALSREALSYGDRTNAAIRQGLEACVDEIATSFSTMFNHYETLWEAKQALGVEIGLGRGNNYGYNQRGKFLSANALYRGVKFEPYIQVAPCSIWTIENSFSRRATTSLKSSRWDFGGMQLSPAAVGTVFIDDLPPTPKSRATAKVRAYVEENCARDQSSYVFRVEPDQVEAFIETIGNPEVVLTSSLPEPEKKISSGVKAVRPNVRLFTYTGQERIRDSCGRIENLNPGRWGNSYKGVSEITYLNQPNTGILVIMENFTLPTGLRDKITSGLIAWDELHFTNTGDAVKLTKSWRTFDDVFNERLKHALAAYEELPQRLALKKDNQLHSLFYFLQRTNLHTKLNDRQKKSTFGKICNLYSRYIEPLTNEQVKLSAYVEPTLPKGVQPDKLAESFRTNHKNLNDMIEAIGGQPKYNHLFLEFV